METYQIYQIHAYYGVVWLVGFLCGISRTVRDDTIKSIGHTISVGMVSGFLSFGVVAIYFGVPTAGNRDPVLPLGIAALVGLAGKEIENDVIRKLFAWILDRFSSSQRPPNPRDPGDADRRRGE